MRTAPLGVLVLANSQSPFQTGIKKEKARIIRGFLLVAMAGRNFQNYFGKRLPGVAWGGPETEAARDFKKS
jgi:hypothetical protein